MSKRINADDAAGLVRSGDTVASVGVIGWVTPDALLRGVADRFRRDSEPRDLTFYFLCGTGDSIDIRGMDHVAVEGLDATHHFRLVRESAASDQAHASRAHAAHSGEPN